MPLTDELAAYLEKGNPYPALNLLESNLVCSQTPGSVAIPEALSADLAAMFEKSTIDLETQNLQNMGVLKIVDNSSMLIPDAIDAVSDVLRLYKRNLNVSLNGRQETAERFSSKLVHYLAGKVPDIHFTDSPDGLTREITWQDEKYTLQIAISAAWLPVVAEELARNRTYLALLGPFAAQNWSTMHRYYAYPEFRNFTAYFDPWHRQKMNISRGGLFTYFDWFLRDEYGLKFFIPKEFSIALQNLGLLRYNDEK
ncbi:MAG: hypothetical protein ACOWWM_19800 [Desulfobacterales bacterium]